jgi:glycine/D-amino acid oxidase-like deaminating enzyme
MSATAEFVGYDRSSTPADYADIIDAGNELFPGAIDWDTARYRTGLRPMTPDGPPLIGLGRHDNLYYNTGHGHVGWTMACGSARMLADLIDERRPDIDPTPYSPSIGIGTDSGVSPHPCRCRPGRPHRGWLPRRRSPKTRSPWPRRRSA